jgi:hypothetical protein
MRTTTTEATTADRARTFRARLAAHVGNAPAAGSTAERARAFRARLAAFVAAAADRA